MATETKDRAKEPVMPESEAVTQLQSQLGQAAAENEALAKRNSELAGYQAQARESTEAVAKLQEQLKQANADKDAAVKEAALAKNAALNASAQASSDGKVVEHARKLAAAVKDLLDT